MLFDSISCSWPNSPAAHLSCLAAGVYNEEVWESLDFVLAQAATRNLRLIIPIEVCHPSPVSALHSIVTSWAGSKLARNAQAASCLLNPWRLAQSRAVCQAPKLRSRAGTLALAASHLCQTQPEHTPVLRRTTG